MPSGGLNDCTVLGTLTTVIVCHCEAVSDRAIRKAVRKGAQTVDEIAERCRAGAYCGGCTPEVARILDEQAVRLVVAVS